LAPATGCGVRLKIAVLRAEPALAELVLPPLRADYRAVETYVFEPGMRLGRRHHHRRGLHIAEHRGRACPTTHPAWAIIQSVCESIQLALGKDPQVGAFVQILAQ
jgi:hypothetical protein